MLSAEIALKAVEGDIITAKNQIDELEQAKQEKNIELINMEIVLDNITYYMEHLDELLLGTPDPLRKAAFFSVLFENTPSYDELLFYSSK